MHLHPWVAELIDLSITQRGHTFSGCVVRNYHRIGSLLPEIGKRPQFAKLYIYDTENEINNRMNCLLEGDIDPEIVQDLSVMLE